MYKPPQTTNRVRSLRNKFENYENKTECTKKNEVNSINKSPMKEIKYDKPCIQRQISDPLKINIKRTPAFRIDKTIAENSSFNRNCFKRNTMFEDKLKQYSAVKNNCDIVSNCENKDILDYMNNDTTNLNQSLLKFDTANDSELLDGLLDNLKEEVHCNNTIPDKPVSEDLQSLYTAPIPKGLRSKKNTDDVLINNENIFENLKLSDTLKSALKKPLPQGPAPRKPPRTFQHVQINCDMKKNNSFLHLTNGRRVLMSPPKKTDPKYMLNKLETALRNNKVLCKKQYKSEISTTSGEDSDDSLLFKSKCIKVQQKPSTRSNNNIYPALNFNCLSSMNCSKSEYEKINQPTSSFFLDNPIEPIYVEPYHFLKDRNGLTNGRNSS